MSLINKFSPSSGHFYPAVIERFGAFGSQLVGLIKMLTGDGDRDPLADDDYVFATRSRTTDIPGLALVLYHGHC